jgi:Flp pilus assembly pilin Flp
MHAKPPSLPASCDRARGQAAVEYLVVLGLTTLVIVVATVDPSVLDQLIAAVKSFFKAFSFALSIPAQDGF